MSLTDKLAIVFLYLTVGYLFTLWFSHRFLTDSCKWDDGFEFGAVSAILMNIVWIAVAFIMLLAYCLDMLSGVGSFVKKFYRL